MKMHDVEIDETKLAAFCRANHIRELLIFGSLTRDSFGPASDVDVAIEYEPNAKVSLFDFAGHEMALEEMIGRPVHLTERSMIPPTIVEQVLSGAVCAYAA